MRRCAMQHAKCFANGPVATCLMSLHCNVIRHAVLRSTPLSLSLYLSLSLSSDFPLLSTLLHTPSLQLCSMSSVYCVLTLFIEKSEHLDFVLITLYIQHTCSLPIFISHLHHNYNPFVELRNYITNVSIYIYVIIC